MNLYLLRHGLAVEPGTHGCKKDSDRFLTIEGRRKLADIAKAMKEMELSFDLILSSPFVRARQTAEIVADTLNCRNRLEFCDLLVPDGTPRDLVAALRRRSFEEGLLVGHEPLLGNLASFLVSGSTTCWLQLKKGGLCKLGIEKLKSGRCARLEWLLTPRQMAAMT